MSNKIDEKAAELTELRQELGTIELNVIGNFTLADAIREGSLVSEHNQCGWGNGENSCALTAAVLSARSRGFL
jgi:hypothetical protein